MYYCHALWVCGDRLCRRRKHRPIANIFFQFFYGAIETNSLDVYLLFAQTIQFLNGTIKTIGAPQMFWAGMPFQFQCGSINALPVSSAAVCCGWFQFPHGAIIGEFRIFHSWNEINFNPLWCDSSQPLFIGTLYTVSFQFLYGSIQTIRMFCSVNGGTSFNSYVVRSDVAQNSQVRQFKLTWARHQSILRFQFLNGAIQTHRYLASMLRSIRFNSYKVRFKQ